MDGRKWTDEEFKALGERYVNWQMQNSDASPTERLKWMMRQYEVHNYGITSQDLALGKTTSYIYDDGKYKRVEAPVRGYFVCNKDNQSGLPSCVFERGKYEIVNGKRLSYTELIQDLKVVKDDKDIQLALETTSSDVDKDGGGVSLLETGVISGFGTATGIIPPAWQNMLLEKVSLTSFMPNFVNVTPMPSMQFKFPLKTSVVEDDTSMQRTSLPTQEGQAGSDYAVKWDNYEINGWKFLRHAELTDEIREMLDQYLGVTSTYMEELAIGQSMLWDYADLEGMLNMLVTGTWRYPYWNGSAFVWTTTGTGTKEIPFGKASVLTTEAKKNYLFQDLSNGTTHDGKIWEPSVTTGQEFIFDSSTLRSGSSTNDDVLEGLMAIASLLKDKHSKMEYAIIPDSRITERLFRDGRIGNLNTRTGDPQFQGENGYLGKISIGGSPTMVDLWEAPVGLMNSRQDDDTPSKTMYPILCGAYGRAWNRGVFTPFNMRVDDGFEAMTVSGADRLRPTQTKVLTTSTKGSSFPGDYHHLAVLWCSMGDADSEHGA